MISTEYIPAGEKNSQIIMHNTHSTRRFLKSKLKRAFNSQKKENDHAARNANAEPSTSRNTTPPPRINSLEHLPSNAQKQPYESLLKAYPQFHDLLDVSNWPTLPPPTNPVRTPEKSNNLRQRPEQLNLMIRPCVESCDSALPPPYSPRDGGRGAW